MQGGGGPLLTGTIEQSKAINCHSELVSESVPQYEQISHIGQTLKRVQGDNISSLRAVADRVAIQSTLVLRLAFSCSPRGKRAYVLSALRTPLAHANATARACAKERAGKAGLITLRQNLPTYRGSASGTPRRALDSTQGKPCSVALLGLAFTMAEILLSLTIIGVVAAITLPSLTGNINERTWNTQRKALYARFSQAIALMPAINGYGTYSEDTDSAGSTSVTDTVAETFVTAGLSKVLKINNICSYDKLSDCGLPDKITTLAGSTLDSFPNTFKKLNSQLVDISGMAYCGVTYSYNQYDTKAAAFETANGESIAVYYNPLCQPDLKSNIAWDATQVRLCANFIYDLNGKKGPNTYGKDIGTISVFYPTDSVVVAPLAYARDSASAPQKPSSDGTLSAAEVCTQQDSQYRLPNKDEAAALFVNKNIIGNLAQSSTWYWTSGTAIDSSGRTVGWMQSMLSGARLYRAERDAVGPIRCVKRD